MRFLVAEVERSLGEDDGAVGDGDGKREVLRLGLGDIEARDHPGPLARGLEEAAKDLVGLLDPRIVLLLELGIVLLPEVAPFSGISHSHGGEGKKEQ
jgi:hypothetical protein